MIIDRNVYSGYVFVYVCVETYICVFFLIHFRVTHDANMCSNATKTVHSKNKFEETNCFEWKRIVKKITCYTHITYRYISHIHIHTWTHTHNIKRYKSISFLVILLLHFTLQIYKSLFCFICYITVSFFFFSIFIPFLWKVDNRIYQCFY